jgi:hypothetical protein
MLAHHYGLLEACFNRLIDLHQVLEPGAGPLDAPEGFPAFAHHEH